jgi:predicted O-linked N-acetylglucosamine transferase (SPINDLY family)
LLLKDSLRGGPDLKNNVIEKFGNNGVGKEQIIFLDHQESLSDHLRLYNKANAALDTFPYPGVTTSCEAILMGLPVLTMKGFNFNSRCGESINKTIDMEHMIADDEKDYLEKAFLLMEDTNLVNKYGINLRKKALSSALFDTETFAKDFQNLILKVNKEYI